MSSKSHVSIEKHQCIVCGKLFDTGAILLDRRIKASMEICTITDYGLCPEDQTKFNEGFVALIECDEQKSQVSDSTQSVKPEDVYRTGVVAHLKRNVLAHLFNVAISDSTPVIFVSQGVIEQLQSMITEAES